MSCLERLATGAGGGGFAFAAGRASDALLAEADQADGFAFLGQDGVALVWVGRGALRLVVAGEAFASVDDGHGATSSFCGRQPAWRSWRTS